MFTTILVGLDGSQREPAVLAQAVEVADRLGGKLQLSRAMQIPMSIPAVAWSLAGDDFEKFLLEHGRSELNRVAERLPEALVGGVSVEMGQPGDVLCTLAKEHKADLVIIGSHGYDRVDRLLGTTAAKVVNRAPCTVMVVRAPS
ncbi:MAG: universal stress protein [Myxococcota bacterium]